eukprot:TRINITY_DN10901_c0_g1_i3.p1 TRINITY_DN10901_c0_g1~~TRINITY_DN10901_c0_g1_i3.p1  ORF type:complete len:246 (-),score=43.02 TRINITY_DN10901_c0_g1_i3:58-756(-)
MVQFTNAVAGTGVENWVAGSDMLAFSRGNKGFYAMGNVNGQFSTGMPDGEYCDIISECQQMITISGGQGNFKPHSSDEPVVAICVGCGKSEAPTTTKPTTPTTRTTTKPGPGPTTSTTTTPKTTTEAQTTAPGTCCETVILSSTGGIAENYPELLGKYTQIGEDNDRPIFKHQTILTTMHLHYTIDNHFKWEGWMITSTNNQTFGYISNKAQLLPNRSQLVGWSSSLVTRGG